MSARQSEVESKLAIESEENKILKEREKNTAEKEKELKKDLEQLTRDYHALQLLLLSEKDQFSRCEMEEPLLVKHATEKLIEEEKKASEWKQKLQQLNQLANVFRNDTATSQLKAQIRQAQDSIKSVVETQKILEEELDEMRKTNRELENQAHCKELQLMLSAEELSQTAEESPLDQNEDVSFEELASRRQLDAEWSRRYDELSSEYTSRYREVSDLHHRSDEMSKWLQETKQTQLYYEELLQSLESCISAQTCFSCIQARRK